MTKKKLLEEKKVRFWTTEIPEKLLTKLEKKRVVSGLSKEGVVRKMIETFLKA